MVASRIIHLLTIVTNVAMIGFQSVKSNVDILINRHCKRCITNAKERIIFNQEERK